MCACVCLSNGGHTSPYRFNNIIIIHSNAPAVHKYINYIITRLIAIMIRLYVVLIERDVIPFSHMYLIWTPNSQALLDLKPLDIVVNNDDDHYNALITSIISYGACNAFRESACRCGTSSSHCISVLRASGKILTGQTGSRPTGVSSAPRIYIYRCWKPLCIPWRIYNMQI